MRSSCWGEAGRQASRAVKQQSANSSLTTTQRADAASYETLTAPPAKSVIKLIQLQQQNVATELKLKDKLNEPKELNNKDTGKKV